MFYEQILFKRSLRVYSGTPTKLLILSPHFICFKVFFLSANGLLPRIHPLLTWQCTRIMWTYVFFGRPPSWQLKSIKLSVEWDCICSCFSAICKMISRVLRTILNIFGDSLIKRGVRERLEFEIDAAEVRYIGWELQATMWSISSCGEVLRGLCAFTSKRERPPVNLSAHALRLNSCAMKPREKLPALSWNAVN